MSIIKPEPKQYPHEYNPENKLDQLALGLERKLSECIYDRGAIDTRMVEDLRNYHGQYAEDKTADQTEKKRANPFIKLTRAKTNAGEAQLVDLLFPNDDKNWGINPTPVPELSNKLQSDTPVQVAGQQFEFEEGKPVTEADVAKRKLQQISDAALAMEKEIEDQLTEAQYNARCRQVIHDAAVIGTGIVKGPVVVGKLDKLYVKDQAGNWVLDLKESFTPSVEVVRPWDFFPDMSASSIEEAEFVFERRYLSKQQLQDLPKRKGFSKDQVLRVLQLTAQQTQHTSVYQDDVRRLAGLSDTINDTRYETWEYHGPISYEVLIQLGAMETPEDPQELAELQFKDVMATVFYCGGIVLGARLHLMTYENYMPYRVFNWEPDDSCMFGYGIPRMVRDEQAILNSVWRMMLDNGAITSGPQIGRNRKHVKPANGKWELTPFKQWDIIGGVTDIKQVFTSVEFNSHLDELSSIYQQARVLFDEVCGVPMLQQGEQGQSSQTLGGMSMLMNAANTVRRRQVKAWDDHITQPLISDFYHYNMMNSDKMEIKGDYQVDARGTSALLVKETQAQAIANFLSIVGSNPVFQPVLQLKAAEILRQWARTQNLPSNMLPTDEELATYQKQLQQQQGDQPQDPALLVEQLRQQQQQAKFEHETQQAERQASFDMQKLNLEIQVKQQQIAASMQKAASDERIELMKLAQSDKLNTEKLVTEMKKNQAKLDQEWQQFMAETQIKMRAGMTANYGLGQ